MDDTWWTRDLPVLDVAVRLLEVHDMPEVIDIATGTGFDAQDVSRALKDMDGSYVDLQTTMGDVDGWYVRSVTPAARRAVGQWPTPENVVARLAEAFSAAADQERDPERRGKLRTIASFLADTGREFAAEVVAKIIIRQTGIS
jgi:hypothetical protein